MNDSNKLIDTMCAWLIIIGLFACCVIVYEALRIYSGETQLPLSAEHLIDYLRNQL